ncbi:MAG: oxygenase MpaB family protein [Gammaproteobacteria bacterium]|nr:oxygenase MpaB family protein [Gammaproteobacteria bacterium]MDE0513890.1 oxygenase MpaB family protein [Gammaproteobacteria bacterium]
MQIPSDYTEGYEKARRVDPDLANLYVQHLNIGDPDADPVVDDMASLSQEDSTEFIKAAMEQNETVMRDAPESLRTFFERLDTPPDWFDPAATLPGSELFYRFPYVFTASLVGAGLIEGFSSGIAKSFLYTGRLFDGNQGVRRLKQNNRHQVELFLPGGLERQGEGWKLTVRLRLVHAQIRRLIAAQPDWDSDAWGIPISAAHMALANTVFSARVLHYIRRLLLLRISAEEREGFMHIWRYQGYLMGIPDVLVFPTEEEANHLFEIGIMCEPPPPMESIAMANTLINAAPTLVNMEGPDSDKLVRKVYRLSRALIGDELADTLQYPRLFTWGALFFFALEQRVKALYNRLFKGNVADAFELMTQISNYEKQGISYKLPDSAHSELSKKW